MFMDCAKMENKTIVFVAAIMVGCLAWQVYAQVNCTNTGAGRFPITGSNCRNYTYCVYNRLTGAYFQYNYRCPTTSVFNPASRQCTTNYTCTENNTTTTTNPTPAAVCTADGFVANPNVTDCSSYIQCVNINGVYSQTVFPCPANTFYDPNTTLCETNYTCPSTFACATAGRFANTADATCQTYFYCVLANNGTFLQYNYTCPSTSVFSPTAGLCTTSYTCVTAG